MNKAKKLLFLTGTRADFGKLKSLINVTVSNPLFDVHLFVTGMHMQSKYGYTMKEIEKCGYKQIFYYMNHASEYSSMDLTLAKTIEGLSSFVHEEKPDMIIVHGDRVETLAGAIVGCMNNILVAHIEGGEISGTVDELIRHAVTKMSHLHFVSNEQARSRLLQMGERDGSIFVIGSPDVDAMISPNLPTLKTVMDYYQIPFKEFGILMFHPVTTEYKNMAALSSNVVEAVLKDNNNYIVIYPNNDHGCQFIFSAYERLQNNPRFKIFPSLRFEYFLTLMKNSQFILGNSSAGIREAPYYGIPTINIGTRQNNRIKSSEIINCGPEVDDILTSINQATKIRRTTPVQLFGTGESDKLFLNTIVSDQIWNVSNQKEFLERINK